MSAGLEELDDLFGGVDDLIEDLRANADLRESLDDLRRNYTPW